MSAFVLFMLGMVFKASTFDHQLVTEDYYEQELGFQDVIEKKRNAEGLKEPLQVEILNNAVVMHLPNEMDGEKIDGEYYFFFAADEHEDQRIAMATEADLEQHISTTDWRTGLYTLKADWQAGGTQYYVERNVFITNTNN